MKSKTSKLRRQNRGTILQTKKGSEDTDKSYKFKSKKNKANNNDEEEKTIGNNQGTFSNKVEKSEDIFPKNFHWIVFIVTLVIRTSYVSKKENWWTLHPDEVFQSLEIAHAELFGYGFRPYEYLPPPDGANNNSAISNYQEYKLGMYSLRSFLFPTIFTIIGQIAVVLGWEGNLFIIWKVFHACVTSCLPLSAFRVSLVLYGSHDIAAMASLLVASSVHMNVFGTHTFINSFLSPILFYVISEIMATVMTAKVKSHRTSDDADGEYFREVHETIENDITNSELYSLNYRLDGTFDCLMDQNQNYKLLNSCTTSGYRSLCHLTQLNVNGNIPNSVNENGHLNTHYCTQFENKLSKPRSSTINNGISKGNINVLHSTVSSAFWKSIKGAIFGVIIYIRIDTSLLVFLIFIPYVKHIYRCFNSIFSSMRYFILGFILSLSFCIYDDVSGYGPWIISPWQWLNFNIIQSMSSRLFGSVNFTYYIYCILLHDVSMISLLVLSVAVLVLFILKHYTTYLSCLLCKQFTLNMYLVFTLTAVFLVYCVQSHKEIRFIYDTTALLLIGYGSVIVHVYHMLCMKFNSNLVKPVFWSMLMIYVTSQWNNFPTFKDKSNAAWTYGRIYDSNHANLCLDFIGRQQDVTGVFIDMNFHMTGGYSILHKNVSIISLMHKEFFEFDSNSRLSLDKRYSVFGGEHTLSLATLRKISDFISVRNTPYLVKKLIEKEKYNYLIFRSSREFLKTGYKEIFRSGTMKVLKRSFHKDAETKLRQLAASIPLGSTVLILNYEANWLLTYGLQDLAEKKLKYSLSLDGKSLQTFKLIIHLYRLKDDVEEIKRLYKVCKRYHGSEKCLQSPKRIVLHDEYNIDLDLKY